MTSWRWHIFESPSPSLSSTIPTIWHFETKPFVDSYIANTYPVNSCQFWRGWSKVKWCQLRGQMTVGRKRAFVFIFEYWGGGQTCSDLGNDSWIFEIVRTSFLRYFPALVSNIALTGSYYRKALRVLVPWVEFCFLPPFLTHGFEGLICSVSNNALYGQACPVLADDSAQSKPTEYAFEHDNERVGKCFCF